MCVCVFVCFYRCFKCDVLNAMEGSKSGHGLRKAKTDIPEVVHTHLIMKENTFTENVLPFIICVCTCVVLRKR